MSQQVLTFAGSPLSGAALVAALEAKLQSLASNRSGTSRPSDIQTGEIWLDTTSATAQLLKFWDGTDDITLATINATTNAVTFTGTATSGANSNITSLSGLTTPLSVAQGGTGGTTASNARSELGLGTSATLDTGDLRRGRGKLLNGAFRVNQRGYVSNTALAQGVPSTGVGYGHDGWRAGAGGCTYTFTQSDGPTEITIIAGTLISKTEASNIDQSSMVISWEGTARARVGVNNAEPSGTYADSPILVTATIGASVAVEFGTGTVGKVQLENGSFKTPFDWLEIGEATRWCQRFLPSVSAGTYISGFCNLTTSCAASHRFSPAARIAPTGLTCTVAGIIASASGNLNLTGVTFGAASPDTAFIVGTVASGLTAGQGVLMRTPKIIFTGAEL